MRVLALKAKLEAGREWSLDELAEVFQVHKRTIRRDIEALEAAGVPVVHTDREQMWGVLR